MSVRRARRSPMATYPVPGKAARWARLALMAALVITLALSDVVLLAPPPGAHASRSEQTGGTYQVTLKVGSGLVYSLPQGASVTLPISVSVAGPQPLAVASVLVQYDPTILRPTGCARRPDAACRLLQPCLRSWKWPHPLHPPVRVRRHGRGRALRSDLRGGLLCDPGHPEPGHATDREPDRCSG